MAFILIACCVLKLGCVKIKQSIEDQGDVNEGDEHRIKLFTDSSPSAPPADHTALNNATARALHLIEIAKLHNLPIE